MQPVDQCLNLRINILHTKAHPVDPGCRESLYHFRFQPPGVNFDRPLGIFRKAEAPVQDREQAPEIDREKLCRGAAAEMQMTDSPCWRCLGSDHLDLLLQGPGIGFGIFCAPVDLCRAATIPAKLVAEGYMQIDRQPFLLPQ